MSLTTTESLLQAKHLAISGVTSAPTAWPEEELDPTNFPQVLMREAEGQLQKVGGKTRRTQTWEVNVFLREKRKETRALAKGESKTLDQSFGDMYTDPDNRVLSSNPSYIQLASYEPGAIRSTGFIMIDFFGKDYYGFRYFVRTIEMEL